MQEQHSSTIIPRPATTGATTMQEQHRACCRYKSLDNPPCAALCLSLVQTVYVHRLQMLAPSTYHTAFLV